MEPVTQIAVAATMARAGVRRFSTLATTAVIVGGVIPAIDFAGVLGGPRAYLTLHRTFTHSILGGAALAVLVAWVLWRIGRKWEPEPARFPGLLAAAACGVAGHLLLDLGDNYGEKLLWPFSQKWYAWNLWPQLDPWLLLLLALTLGVPWLLAVVGEEMGARQKRGASVSGIVALLLVSGYCGWRARLHSDALVKLYSNTYHGAEALGVEAYPSAMSPFRWRGVIDTYNSIDIVQMQLGPNASFEPDMALTHYKPENSPALRAAENAPGLATWRNFARFPIAEVTRTETGHEVFFRDLRYTDAGQFWLNPTVTVRLDKQDRVTRVKWRFGVPQ
ncbi:MAG: metal-dependent hydrolase [Acidobacteriota bacterium]|nr:metal-dependent hydrolase [Acidobacteriota bacterium]